MAMAAKKINQVRKSKKQPCAIDLFAGCGGLTLGLRQAGFVVLGAVEADPNAVETYKANHKGVVVKRADIRTLSAKGLRRELKLRLGAIDLLAGFPPCQGFSTLRTRNGANRNRDARNELVHEMVRFARAFRPKTIMMENVPRLIRHKPFKDLCEKLRRLGYHLTFGIKDAARYGVPQRRRRLILLAGLGFDIRFAPETARSRTVGGAINRLAEPGRSRDMLHNLPERKRADRVRKLI